MTDLTSSASRRAPGASPADNPYAPPVEAMAAPASAWTVEGTTASPPPLYWRMLRLRHVRPNGWQRALLVEGIIAVAVTLVLADVASAWTLVVLPLATALVVKAHDLIAGSLPGRKPLAALPPATLRDYAPLAIAAAVLVLLALVL